MKRIILLSLISITFLSYHLPAQQLKMLEDSAEKIINNANLFLTEFNRGYIIYEYTFKPLLAEKIKRYNIYVSCFKNAKPNDSFIYIYEKYNSTDSGQCLFINNYFYSLYKGNIYMSEYDALKESEVRKKSNGRLYLPLIFNNITMPPKGAWDSIFISDEVLNSAELIKIGFYNSQESRDSNIFYFNKSNYQPIKIIRSFYANQFNDIQVEVFDFIEFAKKESINEAYFENILVRFMESGQLITEEANYNKATKIIDTVSVANDWITVDSSGNQVQLYKLNSKLALFDFAYLSCVACYYSLPHLQRIYEKYSREDVFVCWINPIDWKQKSFVNKKLKEKGITFPILYDIERKVVNQYEVYAYPTLLLIDLKSKRVLFRMIGFSEAEYEKLNEMIELSLKK